MYTKFLTDSLNRYDYLYYLTPGRPYIKDGTRAQTKEDSEKIGNIIKQLLEQHKVDFKIINELNTQVRYNMILKDVLGVLV